MTGSVRTDEVAARWRPDQPGRVCIVIPAYDEAATIGDIVAPVPRRARRPPASSSSMTAHATTPAISPRAERRHGAAPSGQPGQGREPDGWDALALAQGATSVVTLDGDGQHRPEDLPRLLACGQSWPRHIVIGSRRASGRAAPRARFIANRVADFWVSWAARHPIDDSQCGFRVYPAELAAPDRRTALPGARLRLRERNPDRGGPPGLPHRLRSTSPRSTAACCGAPAISGRWPTSPASSSMVAGKLLALGHGSRSACGGRSRCASGNARSLHAMPPLIEMVWPVI